MHTFRFRLSTLYFLLLLGLTAGLVSCGSSTQPKPYGYFYIATPDTAYAPLSAYTLPDGSHPYADYPYDFALSRNAVVVDRSQSGDPFWINIHYPTLNTDIHCSYKPVHGNLRQLTDDATEFVYKHAQIATAIPEREYVHPDEKVYGVLFSLEGNAASPSQFFVTDSVHHFFRASVYSYCAPNADSLAPVYQYIQQDVIHMIETLTWR